MTDTSQRSLGELVAELSRDTATLLRKEIELAQVEMRRKISEASRSVGYLVAGGALAYAGLLVLLGALVIVLRNTGLSWWAAALIVAMAVLGLGALLVQMGLSALKAQSLAPTDTMRNVRETARAVTNRP